MSDQQKDTPLQAMRSSDGRTNVIHFGHFAPLVMQQLREVHGLTEHENVVYMDADMLRIADSGRILLIEWKHGCFDENGNVAIDPRETFPPIKPMTKAAERFASYWLVLYADNGSKTKAPSVMGVRSLVGPDATDHIQECNNEQFAAALADWERKNRKSNTAYVGSAFAWQALDLAKESLKYNTGAADEPLLQLYELLHRKYGERH